VIVSVVVAAVWRVVVDIDINFVYWYVEGAVQYQHVQYFQSG
jgi:hypothetical protein